MSGDAYHMTAPVEDGDGAVRVMQAALDRARRSPRGG
jgi:3-oxoacyl-(acyl-carrier-protein) synthase